MCLLSPSWSFYWEAKYSWSRWYLIEKQTCRRWNVFVWSWLYKYRCRKSYRKLYIKGTLPVLTVSLWWSKILRYAVFLVMGSERKLSLCFPLVSHSCTLDGDQDFPLTIKSRNPYSSFNVGRQFLTNKGLNVRAVIAWKDRSQHTIFFNLTGIFSVFAGYSNE